MMALAGASTIFLRWLPHHGLPVLALLSISVTAAAVIYFTQRRRYSTSSHGITRQKVNADIAAVLWTALAGSVLGIFGIAIVLAS
ncbi:uncharacterized membrane protein YjgN (DUF898 family) [Arthrobacter sp. B2I5]|nr:uncharacterized membrane protein YjgN (DUF898 family) [Arthrobacter sp. B2I5]